MFRKNKSLLLLALLFMLASASFGAKVAASSFPTDTTKLQRTNLRYDYDVHATWRRIDTSRGIYAGIRVNNIEAQICIDEQYASTSDAAKSNTRVHVSLLSPENKIVAALLLGDIGWPPGNVDGYWGLSRVGHFTDLVLIVGTYTLTVTYELYIDGVWTLVDTAIHYFDCTYPEPPPDVPPSTDTENWLPIMLSFGIIGGVAFVGFNLAKSRDPTPGIFMLFVGIILSWSIGWLPTWVFVTAIALMSLLSAVLWGKIFKRGG